MLSMGLISRSSCTSMARPSDCCYGGGGFNSCLELCKIFQYFLQPLASNHHLQYSRMGAFSSMPTFICKLNIFSLLPVFKGVKILIWLLQINYYTGHLGKEFKKNCIAGWGKENCFACSSSLWWKWVYQCTYC